MKKVAILINDIKQQYEGLHLSLGVSLNDLDVQMVVFSHEIANMDEAYRDNMEFLEETIEMLDEDAPELLSKIHEAAAAGNAEAIVSPAHTLKGMLSNFCADKAEQAALHSGRLSGYHIHV